MRILMCLALVSLSACTRPETPRPVVITEIREVPVAVACLKPGQKPQRPSLLKEDQAAPFTLTEVVGRLRAKLRQWSNYGQTADELLTLCGKVPKQ